MYLPTIPTPRRSGTPHSAGRRCRPPRGSRWRLNASQPSSRASCQNCPISSATIEPKTVQPVPQSLPGWFSYPSSLSKSSMMAISSHSRSGSRWRLSRMPQVPHRGLPRRGGGAGEPACRRLWPLQRRRASVHRRSECPCTQPVCRSREFLNRVSRRCGTGQALVPVPLTDLRLSRQTMRSGTAAGCNHSRSLNGSASRPGRTLPTLYTNAGRRAIRRRDSRSGDV